MIRILNRGVTMIAATAFFAICVFALLNVMAESYTNAEWWRLALAGLFGIVSTFAYAAASGRLT